MNKKSIFSVIILFLVLSITVGFSAFASEMSISKIVADVRIEKNVRITGVEILYDRSNDITLNNLDYDVDSVLSNVSFNSTSSYVVYKVTITNFGNARAGVYNVNFGSGYVYDVLDSAYGSMICDASNKCNLGASTDVIFKVYPSSHSIGNHVVDFDFDIRQYYDITYQNVSGSYADTVIGGEGLYVYFSSPKPTGVKLYCDGELIDSSKYSYRNGDLEYQGVWGNILVEAQYEYSYEYMGDYQEFTAPVNGTYRIELWGAQGGHEAEDSDLYEGAYGGYTRGDIQLSKGTKLYVYVGEQPVGKGKAGGYNGGGDTFYDGSGGGGATDIRLNNSGMLNFDSLKSRIMVAAGGGGGYTATSHTGGGLIGYGRGDYQDGKGGTQTSGGAGGDATKFNSPCYYYETVAGNAASGHSQNGSFGKGGNSYYFGTGGGGGYYGGGSGVHKCIADGGGSGAGGSSFVSGHNGCDAVAENSTSSNIIHTGQSVHYSGYKFTNTVIIDGRGYNWLSEIGEKVDMPTHDGKSTMVGNSGGGYAKIYLVG